MNDDDRGADEVTQLHPGGAVVVTRGSDTHAPGTPGSLRTVAGIYLRTYAGGHLVRLLENDSLATKGYCMWRGDKGTWKRVEPRPDIKLERRICLRCDGDGFIMVDLFDGGNYDCAECPVCKGTGREK